MHYQGSRGWEEEYSKGRMPQSEGDLGLEMLCCDKVGMKEGGRKICGKWGDRWRIKGWESGNDREEGGGDGQRQRNNNDSEVRKRDEEELMSKKMKTVGNFCEGVMRVAGGNSLAEWGIWGESIWTFKESCLFCFWYQLGFCEAGVYQKLILCFAQGRH